MTDSPLRQVCADLDGTSAWFYNSARQTYEKRGPDGEINRVGTPNLLAHLFGRDIPNPDKLWLNRCQSQGVTTNSIEGLKLKPTQTVYNLFADWQGVQTNA